MERLIDGPKVERFNLMEHIASGNLYLLDAFLRNENTEIIFDSDGVKINSPKKVLGIYNSKNNHVLRQHEIDCWDFMTQQGMLHGLSYDEANKFEELWYKPEVLGDSEPYLFMRPLIRMLARRRDPNKTFVLTARKPHLKEATIESYKCHFPQIPEENILIRENELMGSEAFKKVEIKKRMPCIFVEDSFANLEPILNDPAFANCLCVHVPLGLVKPNFHHERLIVLKRFPLIEQGMRPLYEMFKGSFDRIDAGK